MPFDPRTKSRNTTTLPAALRDELGLPAPNAKRSFRAHDRRDGRGKPQLKAIGRPQSAINGVDKGTPRGPIKSLRNQEKEQHERHQQAKQKSRPQPKSNANHAAASASNSSARQQYTQETEKKQLQKRKKEQQPERELKVIKKPKTSSQATQDEQAEEPTQQRTRLNPFTGEMETVKSSAKKSRSSSKQTALEKMLAKVEAGPSSSKAKSKASDALGAAKKKSRQRMSQQEKDEEDEIRWLEYSLSKSRQGEDVVRDDLDDFLDDLDRFHVGMYDESASEEEEETEAEQESDSGLEEVTASEEDESEEEETEMEEESQDQDGLDVDDMDAEGVYDFDSNDEGDYSNWDAAMATTDEEEDQNDEDQEASESEDGEEDSEAEEARALISGTAVTTTPNASSASLSQQDAPAAATRYVPPALRAKLAAESSSSSTAATSVTSGPGVTEAEMDPVAAQKLRRQAQGLLNRLGDANIDTILTEYESLYRTHPRAHVTSTITQLILDTITSRTNLIDTFVILYAALVAALHKIVGVEFAAYFVQRLVEELTKHYEALKADAGRAAEDDEGKGKECANLTVLACELYNLHVVACPLIYDLIRMFLGQHESEVAAEGSVGEVDIELVLKTFRSCGYQLRSDDASSLKSIIALTQTRVSSSSSTRTKFMLERMAELQKNAKASKGGAKDTSNPNSAAGQLLTRMNKFLGGMGKKRTVRSYEPLRIGLKDLKDAHKKGKWWLVGAAWTGQTDQSDAQGLTKLLPMNARANAIQSSSSSAAVKKSDVDEQQEKLLSLARAQGMNTDARRTVFITLLTAEDYKQAAENVLLLKLSAVQRREVIRVLVHCVGSEAEYNPYYTLIGSEICRNDHSMRITLQYCLWDFLREIGEKEVGGEKFAAALFDNDDNGDGHDDAQAGVSKVDARRVANLARAYAWWLTHDCLSLQAFKTVDFTMIQPRPAEFIGLVCIHMILSLQSKSAAKTLHLSTVTAPVKEDKIGKLLQASLAGGSADLAKGLLFFLNTKLDSRAQKYLVLGQHRDRTLKRKMQPLLDTVSEGTKCMVTTVQAIVQQFQGVAPSSDAVEVDMEESDAVQDDF